MIWKLNKVDQALIDAFTAACDPDQAVIDAYLARKAKRGRPQQPMKHQGVKRWYYLMQDNSRITLVCIGRPLEEWQAKPAKIIVGTQEVIGEFPGNREVVGLQGLKLTMQPLEWLDGEADQVISDGATLLTEISEQILDHRRIEQSQEKIARRYQWQ